MNPRTLILAHATPLLCGGPVLRFITAKLFDKLEIEIENDLSFSFLKPLERAEYRVALAVKHSHRSLVNTHLQAHTDLRSMSVPAGWGP